VGGHFTLASNMARYSLTMRVDKLPYRYAAEVEVNGHVASGGPGRRHLLNCRCEGAASEVGDF
jgi:hypothetical protein